MNNTLAHPQINGLDADALAQSVEAIAQDPAKGRTKWQVATHWRRSLRSDTSVKVCHIGGQDIARDFTIRIDEPYELCGTNQFANPQEYLLAALNACMIVGYAVGCASKGIALEELRIETEGEIDLRGFLGLDSGVKAGYENLRYTVHIKGDGTPEQFTEIHENVKATSPNRYNLATAIPLHSKLVVN